MRAGWIFPAELILPSAYIRRVWRKLAREEYVGAGGVDFFQMVLIYRPPASGLRMQNGERECAGAGGMDFSGGVNFIVCLHPVCLCKPASGGCVRAGGMDCSSGFSFIVHLPPAYLVQNGERGMRWGGRDGFFLEKSIIMQSLNSLKCSLSCRF